MFATRVLLRIVLLLALVLLGTVPDGMMRQAGPDGGIRLVLCTPDGTKEVWLGEDGEITPVEADQTDKAGGGGHDGSGRKSHCVQVALASQDAPPPLAEAHELVLRPAEAALPPHQIPYRRIAGTTRRTRAPPVSAV